MAKRGVRLAFLTGVLWVRECGSRRGRAMTKAAIIVFTFCLLTARAGADSGWFWQNPLPQRNSLNGVAMLDADTVIAVGDPGTILRSTDGGATWIRQKSGTTSDLTAVSFTDANTGTAVGWNRDRREGTILRTTDGGATWTPQSNWGGLVLT